ncbi:MAG: hypothetical protein AN484_11415 [Aphanizomenon flos-aquae WA102]|jgi:hypothetical protein|uniref:Uncharacterized protein n=1 Tax=Aphanizomenon flos-aquae WA102 TaxID=1710896 RepID=A0A1B7X2L5_APHFL|nr:MAG: hypothetical protein AN484_11415 [Aphanizomenon flos-aquae WA102]
MIICLIETYKYSWEGQGEMYIIDTSLLSSEPFRSFLESAPSSLYIGDGEFCTSEKLGWSWQYESDIQRAVVKPPQLVEKLVSVTFDNLAE